MPKKVPFQVIHNTGWEEEYSPKTLEVHSPFGKGWRSPRFCLYPQELVMKIDPPARIRKLQILSHQYLISSVVELYIGHFSSVKGSSMERTRYERLGYISFSSNEESRFKSMELKSVNVDCMGELVKLVFYQNHINHLNLYNQVGLVAFNIIGDPVTPDKVVLPRGVPVGVLDLMEKSATDPKLASLLKIYLPSINQSHIGTSNPVLKGGINKPMKISPMDDLKFAISQDPETADIIRRLERKKMIAVEAENFREAKKLKLVIEELSRAGEVLCRYEVEKKQAIEREDYDTAKLNKEKLDEARRMIYAELGIHGLLSGEKGAPLAKVHTGGGASPSRTLPKVIGQSPGEAIAASTTTPNPERLRGEERVQSPVLPPIGHNAPPPVAAAPNHTHPAFRTPADERPLPALRKSGGLPTLEEQDELSPSRHHQAGEGEGEGPSEDVRSLEDDNAKPEPLTEKQINQVSLAVDTFGMETMEELYAKQFSVREKALGNVQRTLTSQPAEMSHKDMTNLIRATCQVIVKGLDDKVFSTYQKSHGLLEFLLGGFSEGHTLSNQDLSHIVDKVVPVLLTRTGDLSPRISEAALDNLSQLMRLPKIKEMVVIGPMLVLPFKTKHPPWRLIRARIVLLERMLEDPGILSSGLNVKKIMTFVAQYLEHSSGEVRDVAVKCTLRLYRLNGPDVRALMPVPDNATSRKKTLWKIIFEGFDKIDGVPTPAEREAMNKAAQKAKTEEILQLQKQIATMKKMVTMANLENANSNPTGQTGKTGPLDTGQASKAGLPDTEHGGGPSTVGGSSAEQRSPGHPSRAEASPIKTEASIDKMCVFCGQEQVGESQTALEQHYLNHCPMLRSCPHCHQVTEISGLINHWLTECEAREKFQQCPLCKEAVLKNQFDDHVASGGCRGQAQGGGGGGGETARCPLCHQDILVEDEGWKKHLMGPPHLSTSCPEQRKADSGKSRTSAVENSRQLEGDAG